MSVLAIQRAYRLGGRSVVDRWLRFAAPVQERYDSENAARRRRELRSAIFVGLALYNVYNVTSLVLLPDILVLSVVLRIGLVTPTSLGLIRLIERTSPRWAERLVLIGILNAYFVPVFLFWLSSDPHGLFTFGELSLTIIFANMLLALRFRHATFFTACALATTFLALATKTDLGLSLGLAFAVQIATACTFGLYANHCIERRRCDDYVTTLEAGLRAKQADADRRKFRDQSRTDALTGLPNRRHLTQRLEERLATLGPMALMMIDIDHFKLYNDAFGHPAGDECLRRVAETFAAVARANDVFCARFGGEEFTFLIGDGRSEAEVARLARLLVQAVEALAIPHPARPDGLSVVTISVGVARRRESEATAFAELVATADRALYAAKRRGRNGFAMREDGAIHLLDA